MKFQMLTKTKMLKNIDFSCFQTLRLLINVKMPTINVLRLLSLFKELKSLNKLFHLTDIKLASFIKGTSANSTEPDQMLHNNIASDQVLHWLLTEFTYKTYRELKLTAQQPLNSKQIFQSGLKLKSV